MQAHGKITSQKKTFSILLFKSAWVGLDRIKFKYNKNHKSKK